MTPNNHNDIGRRAARAGGFTLPEILATSLIVMVGFAGLMSFMTWMMYAVNYSEQATAAIELAQERMETLVAGGFTNSTSGSSIQQPYSIYWEVVAPTTPCNLIKKLTVTVNWSGPETKHHSIVLKSMDVDTKPSMVGISFTNIGGI